MPLQNRNKRLFQLKNIADPHPPPPKGKNLHPLSNPYPYPTTMPLCVIWSYGSQICGTPPPPTKKNPAPLVKPAPPAMPLPMGDLIIWVSNFYCQICNQMVSWVIVCCVVLCVLQCCVLVYAVLKCHRRSACAPVWSFLGDMGTKFFTECSQTCQTCTPAPLWMIWSNFW